MFMDPWSPLTTDGFQWVAANKKLQKKCTLHHYIYCVVPENIPTYTVEGNWEV